MPTSRIDEISDRLAEMRLALPGLADRSPNALRFLARELDEIVAECSEWTHRWQTTLVSAQGLAGEVSEARREAGPDLRDADPVGRESDQIHTED